MMFDSIVYLGRFYLSIIGHFRVKDMPELFIDSIETHFILKGIHLLSGHVILPILGKGLDGIANPDQKIGSTLTGGLPHILNCVPLFMEHQDTTVMITNLLHDQTEIRGVVMIMSHPIKDSSCISFKRHNYLSHKILILIIISVVSNDPGPAQESAGYVVRMSIFTSKFGNVYLVVYSSLLLLPTVSPSIGRG